MCELFCVSTLVWSHPQPGLSCLHIKPCFWGTGSLFCVHACVKRSKWQPPRGDRGSDGRGQRPCVSKVLARATGEGVHVSMWLLVNITSWISQWVREVTWEPGVCLSEWSRRSHLEELAVRESVLCACVPLSRRQQGRRRIRDQLLGGLWERLVERDGL